jgi:D-methionine transport system substrate-binding protein
MLLIVVFLAAAIFLLSGCAGQTMNIAAIVESVAYHPQHPVERTHLRVGVVPGPYGDMFMDYIYPLLATQGYTVERVDYGGFAEPNPSLAADSTDLNMFQHSLFLNNSKFEHDFDLSPIVQIPTISMGVFSHTYADLDEIEPGATMVLPDDPTNLARGLRVLEAAGLISLDPLVDRGAVTIENIVRNAREMNFVTLPASQLVAALDSHELAVITGGFVWNDGLDMSDALYVEILTADMLIVIAVRTEDLGRWFVRDILSAVHSDSFRESITNDASPFSGFQRPLYLVQ